MKNNIFDTQFWKTRLAEAKKIGLLEHAIGQGFNFTMIDEVHREIVNREISPIRHAEDKVLDIGCGIGRISGWFTDKQYCGIDFVKEFIEIAQQKYPNKKFILGDIRNLPFEDNQFEWGILISMKGMIIREMGQDVWDKIQEELKRVCKKLLVLEYGNNKKEEVEKYEII